MVSCDAKYDNYLEQGCYKLQPASWISMCMLACQLVATFSKTPINGNLWASVYSLWYILWYVICDIWHVTNCEYLQNDFKHRLCPGLGTGHASPVPVWLPVAQGILCVPHTQRGVEGGGLLPHPLLLAPTLHRQLSVPDPVRNTAHVENHSVNIRSI